MIITSQSLIKKWIENLSSVHSAKLSGDIGSRTNRISREHQTNFTHIGRLIFNNIILLKVPVISCGTVLPTNSVLKSNDIVF